MSRMSRLVALLAVPVLVVACGPGSADTPFAPAPPRHDSGLLVGGNATPTPPDEGTSSTSDTQPAPGDTTSTPGAVGSGLLVGGN